MPERSRKARTGVRASRRMGRRYPLMLRDGGHSALKTRVTALEARLLSMRADGPNDRVTSE